jgi:hypothetical protein
MSHTRSRFVVLKPVRLNLITDPTMQAVPVYGVFVSEYVLLHLSHST